MAAAKDGMRVATLDFDPQRTLGQWHELRRPHDVAAIDHYEGTLEEIDAALSQIDPARYDVVFIDTPPSVELYPEATKILLRRADLVLVPTGVGRFDKMSVIPWMEFLRDYGRPAAFLLNRVKRRSVSLREAKLELGRVGRLVPHEVPDIEDMHRVDDIGCSIVDVGAVNGADECLGAWYFIRHELGI
ncbi:chromosome partitioning protein [Azospirillum sp. BE72]|nr:chromosome partitioning protein [Azospirillum sp. BE72]